MDEQTREALTNRASWLKGAVLLLFYVLLLVATPILIVISLFGWIGLLVNGRVSSGVRDFGQDMARWYGQTARYLTGNASRRPFPFEDLDCPRDEPGRVTERARPVSESGEGEHFAKDTGARSGDTGDAGRQDRAGARPASSKSSPGQKKAGSKKTSKKKAGKKVGKKTGKKKAAKKKTSSPKKAAAKDAGKTAQKGVNESSEGKADNDGNE